MRTTVVLLASIICVACGPSTPEPVPTARSLSFTVIRAGAAESCVEPPHLDLARTEDDWIDIFDIETDCTGASDITLPDVDLAKGPVIAGWLRRARCAGEAVTVKTVRVVGDELELSARTEAQPDPCSPAEQVVEVLVQVESHASIDRARTLTAVLDGQRVASLSMR